MSLFSKLFGSKPPAEVKPEDYNGFLIFAEPQKEAAGFRIGGRIEKEIAGEVKSHLFMRADTFNTAEIASDMTLLKAKQLIEQQGESIFR